MTADPVFIDLETRSACDLKVYGGYNYAEDPTTRLLTVAWQCDGEDHVWLPGLQRDPPESYRNLHLPGVRIHVGQFVPVPLCRVGHRPWIGHNCWTFDRPVWNACTEGFEHVQWIDSYPLALAAGLPGGLDKIGKLLLGEGKYEQGKSELKKAYKATREEGDSEPENVPLPRTILIAKYNVQDVRVMARAWEVIKQDARLNNQELKVLAAHDAINDRGVKIDRDLVLQLIELSKQSKSAAIKKIAELTGGALKDQDDVQSRARVLDWLDSQGFGQFKDKQIGDKKVKGLGLRKELVSRFIDAGRSAVEAAKRDEEDEESWSPDEDKRHEEYSPCDDAPGTPRLDVEGLSRVVNVLELRMQALRITGGKLDTALAILDDKWRARGLFAYWAAHTGRWGGRKIQVQNFPRPKEGVDTWAFIEMARDWALYCEHSEPFDHDHVKARLPFDAVDSNTGKPLYPYLSVDDVPSGLLRGMLIPDTDEHEFATGDFAAIEARVLEWCSGGDLQVFWDQGDPYMLMAERIFGARDTWPKFPDPKKAGGFLPLKKHPYRQVGKVVVLGSGYQLGATKFAVYAAANGIDLSVVDTTPEACIKAYRTANPLIAGEYVGDNDEGRPQFRGGLWYDLNQAVLTAIQDGVRTYAGKCTFHMARHSLVCTLPSGRRLVYRNAHVENVKDRIPWQTDRDFVPAAVYWSPRYGWKYLYGGSIAENIVQAISRDALAASIVHLEEHGGMPVNVHCHDEAVSSILRAMRSVLFPEFCRRLTTCPDWLTKFPLDAECGVMPRYSKTTLPGVKEQVWRNGQFLKGA